MMNVRDWTFLVAAVGHLALALVSAARAGKSPMALPLALLAFDFFGWTFAAFCHHVLGGPLFRSVDVVFTALAPAAVLYVVLTFTGKRRAWAPLLRVSVVFFGGLALVSASSFVSAWGRGWIESQSWAALFLAGWLPTLVVELWLLVRHLRSGTDAEEKARTRLVLAALFVGGAFASTDLWNDMGADLPSLTPLGTLVSTLLLAVVALRFRLFDRNLGAATSLYAMVTAVAAVLVTMTLFQGLHGNLPAMTFGVTVVTLIVGAVVREAASSVAMYRERVERLAVLGRFSAQMAHDLKNPLAALVGAVQVLEGENGPGESNARTFRKMIVDQADRIRAIVETYDRLGRVEPVRSLVRVNDLVTRVATLSRHVGSSEVKVSLDLDAALTECELDPDLVSGALENIVQNALEAMPQGGRLDVRTRLEGGMLRVVVEDTGEGMDARQAERAFDDFYTSKATGSGLGLPFVRRVALAHGGDATIASRKNFGTTVELRLPLRTSASY